MRKQHEKELSTIEEVLDIVLKGDFPRNADSYQEGQESKLIFKILRIAEANQLYQETAAREKQRVQELMVDAAHQMRTPITSMLMFTELLQNKQLPVGESQEFLRRLSFDSQRLNWLVEEFLHMSKFETESMELTKVRQNLSETIQQAILQSSGTSDQQGRFVVKGADVEITHDIKWTREAIGNVLENALKYAYEGSQIEISVDRLISYTRISIKNCGKTISREELPMLFTKYYRGSQYRNTIEGFGIGLYLTKLICEAQGGYVLADSQAEQTTISLFLQN
nr:HAMP domain-containing sensor histidine kinase [Enterococcus raffinosus]